MVDCERAFKIAKCNDHRRDWSTLPAKVLRDISSRLMFVDYYSFGNVCTSWRLAKGLSLRMPFLFLHQHCFLAKPKPPPFCKLLNLADNLSDNFHMPILGGKVCIGSQHGWLVVVDNAVAVISLYNPFSQQVINLPSHAPLADFPLKVRKVVLLRAPVSSNAPLPAAVALLYGTSNVLYKQDGESSWKYLVQPRYFLDVTWWRGKLVGVMIVGDVIELDLGVPEPKFEYMGSGLRDPLTVLQYNKHLINLDGNLLQVWCSVDSQRLQTRSNRSPAVTVKVMQLDPQLLTWIPVDDLSGYSLFVGTSHSFSLLSNHIPGLKDNSIYFIQDLWGFDWDPSSDHRTNWKRDIGVFNMRSGTYEICVLPATPLIPSMFDDLCGHSTTSAFWYAPPLPELQNGQQFKERLSCTETFTDS